MNFVASIKCDVCLLLTMLLPGPPASHQRCCYGYYSNAINQKDCVCFDPSRNLYTQRNELIRLPDFLARQTLFSHSIAPFATFWNHDICESLLSKAGGIRSFEHQKAYGQVAPARMEDRPRWGLCFVVLSTRHNSLHQMLRKNLIAQEFYGV